MKPTIYDIARAAGVSIATVSKVLNNTGRIGASTRQKVLRVTKEMGYERNIIASALAGKNSYTIGFLLPDVNNPYFSEVARGTEDTAFRRGYGILICSTDNDKEKEKRYIRTLRTKGIDGIIIATGNADSQIVKELEDDGVRVVLLSRPIYGISLGFVGVDNVRGGYQAGKHLTRLGHRNIGVITEPLSIRPAYDRIKGLRRALDEIDEPTTLEIRVGEESSVECGIELMKDLLEECSVTSVFGTNDLIAVGVLQACLDAGVRVPEDVSIVGFDNSFIAKIVHPALTTIAQPMYELGVRTAQMVINAIESGEPARESVVLPTELVVRGSTARCVPRVGLLAR